MVIWKKLFSKGGLILILIVIALFVISVLYLHNNNRSIGGPGWPGDQILKFTSPDNTPPTCFLNINHSDSLDGVEITIKDDGDGLHFVNVLRAENAAVWVPKDVLQGNSTSLIIPPRIKTTAVLDPLVVYITKDDQVKSSQVILEAFDTTGDRVECDSGKF